MVNLSSSIDVSDKNFSLNIYFSIDSFGKYADAAFGITQHSVLTLVFVPINTALVPTVNVFWKVRYLSLHIFLYLCIVKIFS